ncbi:unnamed protein product [Rotaria magnacalcarata]|uniref:Uncharacterized protein n=1 Tax=Rotaria magnacalcarata TaxID=392030 RepID=A0A819VKI9_9BILA|nr:unnamed protein product [Rotaria magnacalcarata]CAF2074877.1 unnamed protein product [Rotaria magnacalcarata]CAF4072836.1 unnamed protein product [Rotaria magnacalcarata]CAF4110737.1 unnamed protein product [Rotaria magnacalcarata]
MIPLIEILNVTRLIIDFRQIIPNIFFTILNLVPNIHSLRIITFPPLAKLFGYNGNATDDYLFTHDNKIAKLSLSKISCMAHVFFLIDLFERVKFITLQQTSDRDVEQIIRCFLWTLKLEKNHGPMTLCVRADQEPHDKVGKLQKMIDSGNFLKDYIIYRRRNKFYLEWK